MATPAQITANQQNSLASSGPVTDAGKAVSSQNARRHGYFSLRPFFDDPAEEQEFRDIYEGYLQTYLPVGAPEELRVQTLAVIHVKTLKLHCDASEQESLLEEDLRDQRKAAAEDPHDRIRGRLLNAQATDPGFRSYLRRARFLLSAQNAATRELLRLQAERRHREQSDPAPAAKPQPIENKQPDPGIGFVPSSSFQEFEALIEPLMTTPVAAPKLNKLPAKRRRWR